MTQNFPATDRWVSGTGAFEIGLLFLDPVEEYFQLPGLNPDLLRISFCNDLPPQANAYYCVAMYNEYAILREVRLKYYAVFIYRQLRFISLIPAENKKSCTLRYFPCVYSFCFIYPPPHMEHFPCIRGKFTVDFPLDSGTGESFR